MTDEQINIAVAKACGWQQGNEPWKWIPPPGWLYSDSKFARAYLNSRDSPILAPPNYIGDLNAMHEAEKMLYRGIDQQKYWQTGYGRFKAILGELYTEPFSATARQRAIAFLKTLNLYPHP